MAKMTQKEKQKIKDEKAEKMATKSASLRASSVYNATSSIRSIHRRDNLDLFVLFENLNTQVKSISDGKIDEMETMLITQAQTLGALFHYAAERISCSESLQQINVYGDLIVKTNNACRKSLLAISEIKNPKKTTFIKQQNNAAVNQQINQGNIEASHPKNLEISEKKYTNKLLSEEKKDASLDYARTGKTSEINPSMETVEVIHRG